MSLEKALQSEILKTLINFSTADKKIYVDVMLTQFLLVDTEQKFGNTQEFKEYINNKEIDVDKLSNFFDFPNLSSNVGALLLSNMPLTKINDSTKINPVEVKSRVLKLFEKIENVDPLYTSIISINRDWFIKLNLNKFHIVM